MDTESGQRPLFNFTLEIGYFVSNKIYTIIHLFKN